MLHSGWRGVRYAFFADRPCDVRFRARYVQSAPVPFAEESRIFVGHGRYTHRKKTVAIVPQVGVTSETFTVSVPARGFYYMATQVFLSRFLLEEADVPVAVDVYRAIDVLPAAGEGCTLWLSVPPGNKRFALMSKGGAGIDAFAPDEVSYGGMEPNPAWKVFQLRDPTPGLWGFAVRPPTAAPKSFRLDLTGVPGLLWLSKEKTVSFFSELEKRK